MCGICGIISYSPEHRVTDALLESMTRVLAHRGPDDEGRHLAEFRDEAGQGQIGLGFRRLSIIDLAGGHQPMANEDETIWVAFNGEIYNFQELRPDLEAAGHRFQTRSDTEVLLHLYEEHDLECLDRLRGMFAFAIWDGPKRRLFLARDRLGQKPLVYFHDAQRFAFASELKSLLQIPDVPRVVSPEAIHHYLTYQYVPHPLSILEGFRKLPPAHYALVTNHQCEIRRYWTPDFGSKLNVSEARLADDLRGVLEEATQLRLISDVPLGAFLSGGIDSSIVVGLMSKLMDEPVKTFSIGFEEAKYDETHYAKIVSQHFGTDHRELIVRPDAVEILPKLVWHYDEPFADSSAIPTFYVSQMTAEHVKVTLTGDAGDETFAGYPRYRATRLGQWFDRLPRFLRDSLAGAIWEQLPASVEAKTWRRRAKRLFMALNMPAADRYARWIAIFDDVRKAKLYTSRFSAEIAGHPSDAILKKWYAECSDPDFVGRTTFVDLMTYLPDDLLVKVDIASMAHSLEARSPFLDHKLVELSGAIAIRHKLRGFRSKHLLKRTFADLLPREIVKRPKMGFGVPIAEWFRNELSGYVREVLLDPRAIDRGYFRPEIVGTLIDEHVERRYDHGYRLWALLMLELWHGRFLDDSAQG